MYCHFKTLEDDMPLSLWSNSTHEFTVYVTVTSVSVYLAPFQL